MDLSKLYNNPTVFDSHQNRQSTFIHFQSLKTNQKALRALERTMWIFCLEDTWNRNTENVLPNCAVGDWFMKEGNFRSLLFLHRVINRS